VLLEWDTAYGLVCLGYGTANTYMIRVPWHVAREADVLIGVHPDWGIEGPSLEASDRHNPDEIYDI
jgi:hypothetical protein